MNSMQCKTCGNEYDKAFVVMMGGNSYIFDSFECAIHALAPHCAHCDTKIIGHGVEADEKMYCCAHCASMSGTAGLKDPIGAVPISSGAAH